MPLGYGINPFLQSAGGIAPYGLRYGGDVPLNMNPMPKGLGYFGTLPNTHGGASTELSASLDGGQIPLLVPTLNVSELQLLLSGGEPTDTIYRKASEYASMRAAQGRSPFSGPGELRFPMPQNHPIETFRNLINRAMRPSSGITPTMNAPLPGGVRG